MLPSRQRMPPWWHLQDVWPGEIPLRQSCSDVWSSDHHWSPSINGHKASLVPLSIQALITLPCEHVGSVMKGPFWCHTLPVSRFLAFSPKMANTPTLWAKVTQSCSTWFLENMVPRALGTLLPTALLLPLKTLGSGTSCRPRPASPCHPWGQGVSPINPLSCQQMHKLPPWGRSPGAAWQGSGGSTVQWW